MSGYCSICEESNTLEYSGGLLVCSLCGDVKESYQVAEEVTYAQTAGGRAYVEGNVVTADGHIMNSTFRGRQSASYLAERRFKEYAVLLSLPESVVKLATNIFKQALGLVLTRGRRASLNLGAILYIACRFEHTPHMMIDISEVVQESLHDLAKTYKLLSTKLMMQPSLTDPSLFLERYSSQLQLGNERFKIQKTAGKLLQRMKRDWLHIGRRPSGVCGASLFIACKYHGLERSFVEVSKVVGVNQNTIRNRVKEFLDTPSSSLPLTEFLNEIDKDLPGEDPPAFKRMKKPKKVKIDYPEKFRDAITEVLNRHVEYVAELSNNHNDDITAASLGIHESIEELLGPEDFTSQVDMAEISDDDDEGHYIDIDPNSNLLDIDDDELKAMYIRTPEEIKEQKKRWNKENWEYLKAELEKKKRKKEEGDIETPTKSRKRRKITPSKTVNEAIRKIAKIKKIPKYITHPKIHDSSQTKKSAKMTPEEKELFSGIFDSMKSEIELRKEAEKSKENSIKEEEDEIDEEEEKEENSKEKMDIDYENMELDEYGDQEVEEWF